MKQAILTASGLILAVLLAVSCKEQWNDHYQENGRVTTENIWDYISSQPELSDFAAILKKTSFDLTLSQSQMYTVWAPANGTFSTEGLSDSQLLKEFVQNHVCRSVQSVPDNADTTFNNYINTLNGKRIHFYHTLSDSTFYSSAPLKNGNILCRNGLVHITRGKAPFFNNIWEYLSKDSDLFILSTYLHSFDTTYFDADASTEGGVVDGKIYYVDSVITNANEMLNLLGRLDDESKDFIFLAPTNSAWTEAYQRIAPYFNYGPLPYAKELQTDFTQRTILNNTVFPGFEHQVSPADSLVTTTGYAFTDPAALLKGTVPLQMSNGWIFKADTLHIKPTQSWYNVIKIEAEDSGIRTADYCTVESRSAKNSTLKVSGGGYAEVSPNSTSNPAVTYNVRNTLSAKYDIYCVFVPQRLANPTVKQVLPTKVRFQMNYLNNAGKTVNINLGAATVKTEKMDTVLVRKGFTFPIANYGLYNENVLFKIVGNVSNKETAKFSRKMFIDGFYFKPVE